MSHTFDRDGWQRNVDAWNTTFEKATNELKRTMAEDRAAVRDNVLP